jgi:hypothetical protein
MPDYVFLDGPFAGQTLGSVETHAEGDLLVVEVVDVDLDPDATELHDYRVEAGAGDHGPGLLRHVVLRDDERLAR